MDMALHDAAMANSRRLTSDARLLHDHGRYPSSLALGILAAEEFGKAMLVRWAVVGKVQRPNLSSHTTKHAAFGAIVLAEMAVDAIQEWCDRNRKGIIYTPPGAKPVRPEITATEMRSLAAHLDQTFVKNNDASFVRTYIHGTLEAIKHRSLYVDVKPRMQNLTYSDLESDISLTQLERLASASRALSSPNFDMLEVLAVSQYQDATSAPKSAKSRGRSGRA